MSLLRGGMRRSASAADAVDGGDAPGRGPLGGSDAERHLVVGFFYGGNIAGAVVGCLLAGFYLLRLYDMATATYVAASINLAVAVVAFFWHELHRISTSLQGRPRRAASPPPWGVYVAIGLSGFGRWGRSRLDPPVLAPHRRYGLYVLDHFGRVSHRAGLGSSFGSFLARESRSPRVLLGICQLLLAAAIAWTAYMLARSLPFWPIDPSLAKNPWLISSSTWCGACGP